MIPDKIQTGLGHPSFEDDQPEELNSTCKRLIATVAVMTERASTLAGVVAQHRVHRMEGPNAEVEVTVEDVNHALKYTAMHFLDLIDDEMTQYILDMESYIFDKGEAPRDIHRPRIESPGETYAAVLRAVDEWDTWEPEDEAKLFLKHSVQRSLDQVAAEDFDM